MATSKSSAKLGSSSSPVISSGEPKIETMIRGASPTALNKTGYSIEALLSKILISST